MNRIKISVVTETYPPDVNGCAKAVGKLVEGLRKRGHEVQLARPRQGEHEHRRRRDSFELLPLPGLAIPCYRTQQFGLPAGRHLEGIWESEPPQVIYVATEGPLGYSALKAANRLRIPVVSGFHTRFRSYSHYYGLGMLDEVADRYLRAFHTRSCCTIAPTDQLCQELRRDGFGRVEVLGRGIDAERFSPDKRDEELRRSWGADADTLVMLHVGRIAGEKNIELAAQAFREIEGLGIEARFVLVGDGPVRDSMEKTNPDFVFCGIRDGDELPCYYASGDIFAFPSKTETFGNVTLEAMASGLAVVAYDYAAAQMYIEDGKSGLLAEFDQPDEFIRCVETVAQDRELRGRLRHHAPEYAAGANWESVGDRFEEILKRYARRETSHIPIPR